MIDDDGDSLPNYTDLDSDGDGISDCVEAGGLDVNGDGRYDVFTDSDNDGMADAIDGDVGNDDTAENTAAALQLTNVDTDYDGLPNGYPMGDYDGDGYLDFLDIDVDNDGILDNREVQEGDSLTNTTMQVPLNSDADGDGLDDRYDPNQTDGLVINTASVGSPVAYSNNLDDWDRDGIPNHKDRDSDNDGIVDLIEADSADNYTAFGSTDVDGDGLLDIFDADTSAFANSIGVVPNDDSDDSDGKPDYLDGNSDADYYLDYQESVNYNNNANSLDDYKLMASTYSPANGGVAATNYDNALDADFDSIPNWLDDDVIDNFPNFLDPNHSLYSDSDSDGLVDLLDADNNSAIPFTGILIPGTILPYPSDYNNVVDPQSDWRDVNTQISLPVEWLTFDAVQMSKTRALLSWETATEENNKKFIVEKSKDGMRFFAIGEMLGSGTTNDVSSYDFTDYTLDAGVTYYRIVQVDFNGAKDISETKVLTVTDGADVIAYPNPTAGVVTLANLPADAQITVFDMNGMDATSAGVSSSSFDLSGLRAGIYEIHITSPTVNIVKRIILIK